MQVEVVRRWISVNRDVSMATLDGVATRHTRLLHVCRYLSQVCMVLTNTLELSDERCHSYLFPGKLGR